MGMDDLYLLVLDQLYQPQNWRHIKARMPIQTVISHLWGKKRLQGAASPGCAKGNLMTSQCQLICQVDRHMFSPASIKRIYEMEDTDGHEPSSSTVREQRSSSFNFHRWIINSRRAFLNLLMVKICDQAAAF